MTNLIPKAMKLYGTEALPSVMKEVSQLHEKHVWTSIKHDSIVNNAKIIRSLIFFKYLNKTMKSKTDKATKHVTVAKSVKSYVGGLTFLQSVSRNLC